MLLDLVMSANMLCSEEEWERALEEGVSISLDASLQTRREWAAARGQHQSWCLRARRGHAHGTQHALSTCRGFTLVCVRCGSLVHWMAARCRARKAGRDAFEPGDGCSSRCCSLNHRPAQYTSSQLAMAAALEAGTRLLIAWPLGRAAREVQLLPRALVPTTVQGVRLRVGARSSNDGACAARLEDPFARGDGALKRTRSACCQSPRRPTSHAHVPSRKRLDDAVGELLEEAVDGRHPRWASRRSVHLA